MTGDVLQFAGVAAAGLLGVAVLTIRAWSRGEGRALREDAPVIMAVAASAAVLAGVQLDVQLAALLGAATSAVLCLLIALYQPSRKPGTPDPRRAAAAALTVLFTVISIGLLVLTAGRSG